MTFPAIKTIEELNTQKQNDKSTFPDNSSGQAKKRSRISKYFETGSSPQVQGDYSKALSQFATTSQPELYRAKIKPAELILFTTQLSVMLDSGVVLSDALDAIAEQAEHGTFKTIIMNVNFTIDIRTNMIY